MIDDEGLEMEKAWVLNVETFAQVSQGHGIHSTANGDACLRAGGKQRGFDKAGLVMAAETAGVKKQEGQTQKVWP